MGDYPYIYTWTAMGDNVVTDATQGYNTNIQQPTMANKWVVQPQPSRSNNKIDPIYFLGFLITEQLLINFTMFLRTLYDYKEIASIDHDFIMEIFDNYGAGEQIIALYSLENFNIPQEMAEKWEKFAEYLMTH